jgi:hypothetical protein
MKRFHDAHIVNVTVGASIVSIRQLAISPSQGLVSHHQLR